MRFVIHGQHVLAATNGFSAACLFRSTLMGVPPEKTVQISYIDHRNIFLLPLRLDYVEDLLRRFLFRHGHNRHILPFGCKVWHHLSDYSKRDTESMRLGDDRAGLSLMLRVCTRTSLAQRELSR